MSEKNGDLKLAEIYSINEISNISDIPQNVCNFIRTATKRDFQQQEKNEKESCKYSDGNSIGSKPDSRMWFKFRLR